MKLKGLPIASVGTFTSANGKVVEFTEEELKETAKANQDFFKQGKDCPIVLTHTDTDTALLTNRLYGYLENYRYDSTRKMLVADAEIAKDKEKEFKDGKFRNFSMRRAVKDRRIVNLAIVGDSAIPSANIRNSEITDLSAQYGELDSVDFSLEGGYEENMKDDITEETFSVEKQKNFFQKIFDDLFSNQNKEIKEEIKKTLEEFKQPEKVEEEEDMNTEDFNALIAEKDKKIKEYEDYKAKVEEDKQKEIVIQRKKDADKLIEDFCENGQMLPSQKELANKILNSDSAEDFKAFLALNNPVDFDTDMETFAQAGATVSKTLTDLERKNLVNSAKNAELAL